MPLEMQNIFLLLITASVNMLSVADSHFGITNIAYSQSGKIDSATGNQFDIYKVPIKKAHVGDIDIGYKILGNVSSNNSNNSNVMVLISGGSNTMNFWPPYMLNELSLNNTVLIFDSRGIGNSTSGNKTFSIGQFANDTVGSYGSLCGGKELIPPSPALMKFIDSIENPQNLTDVEKEKILSDVLFPEKWIRENPNYLEEIPKHGVSISPQNAGQLKEAFFTWVQSESCSKLNTIELPTLIIVGSEDNTTPAGNSLNLVKGIPGAWLVQIKGGGHGVMFQYPEEFTRILQTFMAAATPSGTMPKQ
jgi:hypothetical protein